MDAIVAEARAYVYGVKDEFGAIKHLGVKDKAIVLRNLEDDRLHILPYYTRFNPNYYRNLKRRLKQIRSRNAVFLTLTVDPNNCVSLANAREKLAKSWNKLLTRLKKNPRLGAWRVKPPRGCPRNFGWVHRLLGVDVSDDGWHYAKLRYISVIEFTKEGVPHLHALFLGIGRLIDADELREIWGKEYGVGRIVHLKKIKNDVGQVTAYICKYISKALDCPETEFQGADGLVDARSFVNTALAWSLQLRGFNCSRGILDTPKNFSNTAWEFVGSFAIEDAENWIGKTFHEVESDIYELRGFV